MPGGLVPRDPKAETRTRRALGGLASIINSLIENGSLQLVGPGKYALNPAIFPVQAVPVLYPDDPEPQMLLPGPPGAAGTGAVGPVGPVGPALYLFEDAPQGEEGLPGIVAPGGGTTYTGGTGISVTGTVISVASNIAQAETLTLTDTTNNAVSTVFTVDHEVVALSTIAAGFGTGISFLLADKTVASVPAGSIAVSWQIATHASRQSLMTFSMTDSSATRSILGLAANGAAAIGFLGAAGGPASVQTGDAGTALVTFGLMTGTPTFAAANLSGTATNQYILLQDQETLGTNGGAATSATWVTRTVNTKVTDTGSNCTLASNQFTLSAGTYRIRASSPAAGIARHQIRLQNITDATTIATGTSEYSPTAAGTQTRSIIEARFTVAASKALAIQHIVQIAVGAADFGVAGSFGSEIYTEVELEKEAT